MKLTAESTVLDDKKIGDSFATLQVEADGIRTEVGTKVGNNEVISRINQTAEEIKIQADKVNIEGATIFTSGRLSQNSLDGAYDASGSATSAVNGLKTDLSSASGTTVINGGHIETGTLSAGAVNASSGTFDTANIPDLNASKITAGYLSADRIESGSLAVGKIDATSGTFDTANIPNLNASKITAGTLSADRIGAGSLSVGKIDSASGTFNTANIPNLSATKITTDTLDGARINVMGASNGARAALTSTGLDIYNSSNQKKASYGSNAIIYGGAGTYPLVSVTGSSANFMQSANNYASVDSSGLSIYQNGTSVAQFGSSNRIGDYNHKHIQITNTDLNVYDDDGSIPFQVSTATSSTTEPYSIAWYINANSSYVTQAYFKGTIVNNTVSVGVAASGVPTASDTITLTNAGTAYTITVSGVKYTFTRYNGIVTYSIQNTNSAKRSCLVSFTQSYRKTTVKENSHTLDTTYQTVSIEDATGTCNGAILYTYAGVAQLHLRVYHGSSSVSNGGLIYKGVLGGFAPIYDCYMVGQINGIYAVSGNIDSRGNIYIYNTSGGSRTVNSSNMARLSATYLLAQ